MMGTIRALDIKLIPSTHQYVKYINSIIHYIKKKKKKKKKKKIL